MRKILILAAMASVAGGSPAAADRAAAAIEQLGLIGSWASYCTGGADRSKPGLRIVVAAPPDGVPTYTTLSAEDNITTTIRASVLEAAPAGEGKIRLRLQITGGDRDSGPLPETMTKIFEQVIEKTDDGIRLVGADPRFIQKCPEQGDADGHHPR